jgi:hypothetical protein
VEAEHIAQHERCALLRRQLLQRDDERELDRFALLVACFSAARRVFDGVMVFSVAGRRPRSRIALRLRLVAIR